MSSCRSCGAAAETFLSFGPMPVANGFLSAEDFPRERFYPLEIAICAGCSLSQLAAAPPREVLFHDSYPFFTASSSRMAAHFSAWAAWERPRLAEPDPFVVEIGSNDGTLLGEFAREGIRHLGIEPCAGPARAAAGRGVETLGRFFDEETARLVVREHGQADLVLAANCFCHVADLRGLGAALALLLKPGGEIAFEDPYLGDILEKTAYDQIYDEHAVYFSAHSASRWLEPHGLELVDARAQETHGGSMRYRVRRKDGRPPSPGLEAILARERALGLLTPAPYTAFAGRVERSREELLALLREAKRRGRRVAGYAATSKSTTVLNYCGIGPDLIEFISDTTPLKQGKFSPGAHLPVKPPSEFARRPPDYALLFAWNHAGEILEKEAGFAAAGGRWITYVPRVEML